ncbi:MAG: hypothetical protein V4482_05525 [Pseudomonadota bacterium]
MNPLHEQLRYIEERILGWPDNVPTWAPGMDPDIAFNNLESELQHVLNQISTLSPNERDEIKAIITTFQKNIQRHHMETEQRLTDMKNTVDTSFKYVKAVRAYTMQ